MIIALTGFMGSGKSTVGRLLSMQFGDYDYTDLDEYIEMREACSIAQIFAAQGEAAFRELEATALEELISIGGNRILSLGGGTVMNGRCFDLVKEHTTVVYLKASPDTIRLHLTKNCTLEEAALKRPVLKGNGIEELMSLRGPVYEAVAKIIIDTDGRNAADIANDIFYRL